MSRLYKQYFASSSDDDERRAMEKETNGKEEDVLNAKPIPLTPPPNWITPTHPPYAEMIQSAIRTLDEEIGSTAVAIEAYIRENYESLPWGHRNLFPYYFRKLLAVGEIQEVRSSRRYIISPHLYTLEAHRGRDDPVDLRGSMALQISKAEFDPETISTLQSASPMEVENQSDPLNTDVLDYDGGCDGGGPVLPIPGKKSIHVLVTDPTIIPNSRSGGVEEEKTSVTNRRGRPPKKKNKLKVLPSPPPPDMGGCNSTVAKRRGRGRPSKEKVEVENEDEPSPLALAPPSTSTFDGTDPNSFLPTQHRRRSMRRVVIENALSSSPAPELGTTVLPIGSCLTRKLRPRPLRSNG